MIAGPVLAFDYAFHIADPHLDVLGAVYRPVFLSEGRGDVHPGSYEGIAALGMVGFLDRIC